MKSLILASGSPRRAALLRQIGLKFRAVPSRVRESIPKKWTGSISKLAVSLALQKAKDVQQRHPNAVILGADTLVLLNRKIFGKPATHAEAKRMLKFLSGKTHSVITGIAILHKKKVLTDWSETKVKFRRLSPQFIDRYVRSGDPMDKAGAYGIQGLGALAVEWIRGDYFNVVGLPLVKVMRFL